MRINARATFPSKFFKTNGPKPAANSIMPPNKKDVIKSAICSTKLSFFKFRYFEITFSGEVSRALVQELELKYNAGPGRLKAA